MLLTEALIHETIKKKDASMLPTVCILMERPRNRVNDEVVTYWTLVANPETGDTLSLSRAQALDLIDLLELQPYPQAGLGTVYDTTDQQYLAQYRGCRARI